MNIIENENDDAAVFSEWVKKHIENDMIRKSLNKLKDDLVESNRKLRKEMNKHKSLIKISDNSKSILNTLKTKWKENLKKIKQIKEELASLK
jgi:hypothetical protein